MVTELFLNEIYNRISYLAYLYENRTSSINYDKNRISVFNFNLLIKKGYIEVYEDNENKLVTITEKGIEFILSHIEDFKKVS
ncbi:hypothetical protein CLHOM_22220 [Clostridium homopropionicum DSM 5847]|uniref:ArnR1-like winged helix-turn-helix domain-containing protein n=2 Tax=Clostridium TaxID=1485 RepID=A0A0L6Z8X2_9CLOT|nr:hypothetical protein CLHOM_22220 [Clostridium homopropionicum DSM 5847]SFG69515.1 hypothetical protein SAMN04488501_11370 [Clostridium homopropionicum]